MSRGVLAFAVMAVIAVAGACASSSPGSAPTTTGVVPSASKVATASTSPASSAVDPVTPLYGTYTATIPSGVNAAPGEWKLTIAVGRMAFTHPDGHTFSPGSVTEITATEIVLAPDPGCPVQQGTPTDGRYRWSIEDTSLTIEVLSDSCQDRIDTLTSSEWSLSR